MKKQSSFAYVRTSMFKNAIRFANKTGVTRLLFSTVYPYSSTPMSTGRNGMALAAEHLKKLDAAIFLRTFNNRNQVDEGKNKEQNAFDVLSHGYLGDIPLRIITSEELNNYPESKENQLNLLKWSTDSKQIVVDGSGHSIHWSNPSVINTQIIELLNNE